MPRPTSRTSWSSTTTRACASCCAPSCRSNGFRVTVAGHAAEARERLGVLDFDLIVLDVMMPGQTGLDFAAELRGAPTTCRS